MGADQVKAIKESVFVVMGEQKKERVGENPFLDFWCPGPLGLKVSRQTEAQMFEDRLKHRCLRTGKKCRDGLKGSRAEEELERQAGSERESLVS